MMNYALIHQIQSENDQLQQLTPKHGPDRLLSGCKQLSHLAKQLRSGNPDKPGFCLAYTILLVNAGMELDQLQSSYMLAILDQQNIIHYTLQFERVQYQVNLAVSMIL
ncbi:hypothetical protein [Spirosoma sp. KNUC1025]|uniref:hypothetical protein n=1 Tax=Spirosoma sp. KNUC1025 TaxID=2894082 RepID=UPI00386E4013|nr:hypothetical protein LN737_19390 [Spirosoma sp. KNUC1025]